MKKLNNPSSEKGQSLLELSMVMVVLLILLAGIVDLGRMMYEYLTMRDAAQEGAGYAAVFPADCNHIVDRVMHNLPDSNYSVAVTITDINGGTGTVSCGDAAAADYSGSDLPYYGCVGNRVTVIIDHTTEITMPFISAFTGTSVPMHVEIADRIVRPACR